MISWRVLDHERPKLAWQAACVEACRPVIVVADRPPSIVTPATSSRLDVHVVNDLRHPVDPPVVDVHVAQGGQRRWRFGGDVDADECVQVGRIELDVPDARRGLTLDLTLTAGDITTTNHYAPVVTVEPVPFDRSRTSPKVRLSILRFLNLAFR